MANPVEVAVIAGEWTKVTTAIFLGTIRVLKRGARPMLHTYRHTGDAAPTLRTEGATMSPAQTDYWVLSFWPIDVYIWIDGADGNVRIDR